jgi:hypothetical protein
MGSFSLDQWNKSNQPPVDSQKNCMCFNVRKTHQKITENNNRNDTYIFIYLFYKISKSIIYFTMTNIHNTLPDSAAFAECDTRHTLHGKILDGKEKFAV